MLTLLLFCDNILNQLEKYVLPKTSNRYFSFQRAAGRCKTVWRYRANTLWKLHFEKAIAQEMSGAPVKALWIIST